MIMMARLSLIAISLLICLTFDGLVLGHRFHYRKRVHVHAPFVDVQTGHNPDDCDDVEHGHTKVKEVSVIAPGTSVLVEKRVETRPVVEKKVYVAAEASSSFGGVLEGRSYQSSGRRRSTYETDFDDEDDCPTETTCTCVPRELCQRGVIVEDGSGAIQRRGKRGVNVDVGSILSSFGVRVQAPFTNVRVGNPYPSYGCGRPDCRGSSSNGFVNVDAPFTNVRVGVHKRPSTWFTSTSEEKHTVSNSGAGTSVVNVEAPFTRVNVHKVVNGGHRVTTTTSSGGTRPRKRPSVCPEGQVCCRPSYSNGNRFKGQGACGIRQPCGIDRQSGASRKRGECEFGEWPWQALILKKESGKQREILCNGVLIDNHRILTVAQCVEDFKDLPEAIEVRLGEWDVSSNVEPLPHETFQVQEIRTHGKFRNATLHNDIGLLFLDREVRFKEHISPLCMPYKDDQFSTQRCYVTGWGKRSQNSVMLESRVKPISNNECQQRLRRTRLGQRFKLHDNFACTLSKGGDSCKIDGGGPLVCKRSDGSQVLAGLVSWGIDCGDADTPEVFTKITAHMDWIEAQDNAPNGYDEASGEEPRWIIPASSK